MVFFFRVSGLGGGVNSRSGEFGSPRMEGMWLRKPFLRVINWL